MAIQTSLERGHYAAKWSLPKDGEFNDLKVVNQAGIDYANLPDGQQKEDKLEQIVQYFHGYVFKYADLIVRGHIPFHMYNSDTRRFLKYFLPADSGEGKAAFDKVAKHLHLAFPQQSATDIYDTLMVLLLRCVKKYDPNYVVKVQKLVKIIANLTKKKYFTAVEISKKVKFNPIGAIRLLARKGYIKAVRGPGKKLLGYKITKAWPPSKEFLSSGPIGFVYVVQTWFRYYLQEHIDTEMKTLEARSWDMMLQLNHGEDLDENDDSMQLSVPHAEGEMIDSHGSGWAADVTLMKKSMDISEMTPAWVAKTNDKLFTKMTERERHLLYLYYVKELSWKQIAEGLGLPMNQVQKIHAETITFLKGKFNYTNQI